ncbi:hypothetical protein JCM11251_003248 [Rhodosporidiobolus azoricus]
MAGTSKSRSSTSKAASGPKGSLGFSSSKKGVTNSGKGGAKKGGALVSSAQNVTAASSKSTLAGLYPRLHKEALKKMGPPIHREEMHDDVELILRVFDACEDYGPSSRISRLERYERAERLGLEPDPEIGEILRSKEGRERPVYANSVFQI